MEDVNEEQIPENKKRNIALVMSSISTSLFINTLWYELPLIKRSSDDDVTSHVFTLFFCIGQFVTLAYLLVRKLLGKRASIATPVLYTCHVVSVAAMLAAYFLWRTDTRGSHFYVNNMSAMLFVLLASLLSSVGEVAFLDYTVKDTSSCCYVLMGIAMSSAIPQALTILQGLNRHFFCLSAELQHLNQGPGVRKCSVDLLSEIPIPENSTLRVAIDPNKGLRFHVPTFILIVSFVNLLSLLSFIYLRFIDYKANNLVNRLDSLRRSNLRSNTSAIEGEDNILNANYRMIHRKSISIVVKNKHSSFLTLITVLWTSIVLSGPISAPVSHSCYPPNGSQRFLFGNFLSNIVAVLFLMLSMKCNSKLRITYSIAFTSLGTIVMFYFGALVYFGRSASILSGRSYKTITYRLFYGGGSLMYGNTGEYLTIVTWCAIVGIFSYTRAVAIREYENKTKGIDILWLAVIIQLGRLIGACISVLSAINVCILFRTPAKYCY